MGEILKRLFLQSFCFILLLAAPSLYAAQARFDSVYFFQSEDVLKSKQVNFEEVARFSRHLQSQVWNVLKKAKMPPSNGYIVVAVRSDQEVTAWLDMSPNLHEYYDYEIIEAIKKLPAFKVDQGIVVFAIKLAIDTPKHTTKVKPDPVDWKAAKQSLSNPDDVEQLVLSVWPEK